MNTTSLERGFSAESKVDKSVACEQPFYKLTAGRCTSHGVLDALLDGRTTYCVCGVIAVTRLMYFPHRCCSVYVCQNLLQNVLVATDQQTEWCKRHWTCVWAK